MRRGSRDACGGRGAGLAGDAVGPDGLCGGDVLDELRAGDAPPLPQGVVLEGRGAHAVHLGVEGAIAGLMTSEEAEAALVVGQSFDQWQEPVTVGVGPKSRVRNLGVRSDLAGLVGPSGGNSLLVELHQKSEEVFEVLLLADEGDLDVSVVGLSETVCEEIEHVE